MNVGRGVDRFLLWGDRMFTHDSWHRVAYQPVLYFFLWGAAVRIWLDNDEPPIPFENLSAWTGNVWLVLSLVCPPMAAFSWWLILKSKIRRAALIGLWMRFSADVGQTVAILVYHLVTINVAVMREAEVQVYFRYLTGATLIFSALLVVRDVWALAATERLAGRLHNG